MQMTGGIFFYALGLALAPYLYDHELYGFTPFLFATGALLCRKSRLFPTILALFLFCFGLSQYFLAVQPDPVNARLFAAVEQQPVRLEGRVETISDRPDNGLALDIASPRVKYADTIYPMNGKVRLYVEAQSDAVNPGDTVVLLTRLREPRNFRTPSTFDYKRYLLRRNIIATGFVKSTSDIARLPTRHQWSPPTGIKAWRHRIRQLIDNSLPSESAPFVKALAIGDRGAMSEKQRKMLAESGIAHLFAISGLHIGLVAGLLYLIARSVYIRFGLARLDIPPRRLLPPLLLPILCGYMVLTGTAVSTLRALIMLGAVTILCMISRRSRPINILLAAAFLILVFDPLALFEPAFQLSVSGAGGIILFAPWWKELSRRTPGILRYPTVLLAVTCAASLATFPFVLLHFHTLAPAGPLLNLVAVPLVSFILVPLTLLALLLSFISPAATLFCFQLIAGIMQPFFNFIETVLSVDLFNARTIFLTPHTITAIVLVVLFAACYSRFSNRVRMIFITAIAALAFGSGFAGRNDSEMRVVALDVGQGDATLLQTPSGKNYLIDGGGLYSRRFDTGERLVAPALGRLGVDRLDAVILSHDHPDHRNGLAYILKHVPVDSFWLSASDQIRNSQLLPLVQKKNIRIRKFEPGWTVAETDGALSVFVPRNNSPRLNDHSLVLHASHGEDGLLMTGDLESVGIEELAAAASPGPVTLLKLPHHGSRKSDPTPLLNKHRPTVAFSSVGFKNRYGLPHKVAMSALTEASIPLHRTDRHGSISLVSNGHNWSITHWKKGLFR